jgi:ABC-type multidrug transport system fused ATPase/permease subunit
MEKEAEKEFEGLSNKKIVLILAISVVAPLMFPLILIVGVILRGTSLVYTLTEICITIKSVVPIIALSALIIGPIMWVVSWFEIVKGEKNEVVKYIGIGLLLCGVIGLIIAAYATQLIWMLGTPDFGSNAPSDVSFSC